jgi:hypothetical protein
MGKIIQLLLVICYPNKMQLSMYVEELGVEEAYERSRFLELEIIQSVSRKYVGVQVISDGLQT